MYDNNRSKAFNNINEVDNVNFQTGNKKEYNFSLIKVL